MKYTCDSKFVHLKYFVTKEIETMSLTKIKSKETKGKQKALPKLKAILANPNKTKCPILDEKELNHLKLLLQNAIQESKLEPIVFATQKAICLGMESSLRKINNQTSSCVFISLSIKPNYVISLIARNAETKDETQPVYAQPKLENFIEEIFGVKALCMVFPKQLSAISEEIHKWVEERRKHAKIKKATEGIKKIVRKKSVKSKIQPAEVIKGKEVKSESVKKTWSSDFISFSADNHEMDSSKLDGDEAINALSEIIDKIPTSSQAMPSIVPKIERMDVDSSRELQNISDNSVKKEGDDSDTDGFLESYKTLIVHKIKGNPNKKPKKKRKKNKSKNSSK